MPVPPPKFPPGLPDVRLVKPKTPFAGGLRRRWKGPNGQIYEWDYQHGTVERYTPAGKHLGEVDPETGELKKGPDASRSIKP
jgi:Cytotoxic